MASGQFGIKLESTPGTPVTVDKFFPVENVEQTVVEEKLYTDNDITASALLSAPPKLGRRVVGGKCRMKLPNKGGAATLLSWCHGSVVTAGAGPTYTHTYGAGGPQYATVQFAPVDITDTAKPFTHAGAAVTDWSLKVDNKGWVILEFSWMAMDYATGTALATASYTAINPFTFVEGSLAVAAAPETTLTSFVLAGAKNLKTDRFVINNSRNALKALKLGKWAITGQADTDFEGLTMVNAIAAATALAVVFTLSNGTESLVYTLNAVLDGDLPNMSVVGVEPQSLKFRANRTTAAAADSTGFVGVLSNTEASAA